MPAPDRPTEPPAGHPADADADRSAAAMAAPGYGVGRQDSSGRSETPTTLPALPPGTRLLHIGIPKTGTTALQQAAAQRRAELLRHGVCYPGQGYNHREQAAALMGRRQGWSTSGYVADIRCWRQLRAELDRNRQLRGFVSHEFIAECDDAQAGRFLAELGPELQVVITLRGFADLLGSTWQQYVKAGRTMRFEPWLHQALAEPPGRKLPRSFSRRNDQAAIVNRWVRLVGANNVTVVIADKQRRTLLTESFEQLLGLPEGLLSIDLGGGFAANRTLSLAETELIRRLNQLVDKNRIHWDDFDALVRLGAIARIQDVRRPGPHEPGLALPAWAAEKALATATRYAAAVAASGCRVVGDLAVLTRPVATRTEAVPAVTQIPIGLAAEALVGLLSASAGYGPLFGEDPPLLPPRLIDRVRSTGLGRRSLRAYASTRRVPVGALLGAAALRAGHRLRRPYVEFRDRSGHPDPRNGSPAEG